MNNFLHAALFNASDLGIPTGANSSSLTAVLSIVYTAAGIIAVIVIIIAGFLYTLSLGDPAKTKRAKDAILYAVIGLVIIIFAFVITRFVIGGVA